MIKTCRKCSKDAEHYDSIPTCCKECWKARVKAARARNIEYYRKFDRDRRNLPHRKAHEKIRRARPHNVQKRVEYNRMRREDEDYQKAHSKLAYAIKSGKIIRPDHCSRCLVQCFPQAHHDDHSKHLEVMWLCPICHAQRHKELGKI